MIFTKLYRLLGDFSHIGNLILGISILAILGCGDSGDSGGAGADSKENEIFAKRLVESLLNNDQEAYLSCHVRAGDMTTDRSGDYSQPNGSVPDAQWNQMVVAAFKDDQAYIEKLKREHGTVEYGGIHSESEKQGAPAFAISETSALVICGEKKYVATFGRTVLTQRGRVIQAIMSTFKPGFSFASLGGAEGTGSRPVVRTTSNPTSPPPVLPRPKEKLPDRKPSREKTPLLGQIVYINNDDIHVVNGEQSATRLTQDGASNRKRLPGISPDGNQIVFIGGGMIPGDLSVVGSDGADVRVLLKSDGMNSCTQPAWSPDGELVAFACGGMTSKAICVIRTDGTGARNLTNDEHNHHSPAWSPDGSHLTFVTENRIKGEDGSTTLALGKISVIDLQDGSRKQLTDHDRKDAQPSWSPDGKSILFTSQPVLKREGNSTQTGSADLFRISSNGEDLKDVSNNLKGQDGFGSWSPDGKRIAYIAQKDGGPTAVYVADHDGLNAKSVTEGKWGVEYGSTQWTPNGEKILTQTRSGKILLISTDGSGIAELADGNQPAHSPK